MARKTRDTISKNGITYYTSNYFASKTYVTQRKARKFLENFSHEPNSKNPKLYDEKTMKIAIKYYNNELSDDEIRKERAIKEEYENAKLRYLISKGFSPEALKEIEDPEFDLSIKFTKKEFEEAKLNGITDAHNLIRKSVLNTLSSNYDILLNYAIMNLFSILGYKFDIEQLFIDLTTLAISMNLRGPMLEKGVKNEFELEAINRLSSNNGYAIKTKK